MSRYFLELRIYLAAIVLSLFGYGLAMPQWSVSAQETVPVFSKEKQKVRYTPPSSSAPRTTIGGVVRGNCNGILCLIALQPGSRFSLDAIPLTISERPTFFFNIPQVKAGQGFFQIYQIDRDESSQDRLVYQTTFPIDSLEGIMKFKLPKTAPALQLNQTYRWEFSVGRADNYETVRSFVKRIALPASFGKQLKEVSPLELSAMYAQQGIWFEMIENLVDLRTTQPYNEEALNEWVEVLKAVKLDKIAQQPMLNCCKNSY